MKQFSNAEQFCTEILQLNPPHAKAVATLVMALASFTDATSVVSLSQSPLFQHQYSSLTDAIAHLAYYEADAQRGGGAFFYFCTERVRAEKFDNDIETA